MADEKGDINTITNSGAIGVIAVGRGATAINASDNAIVNSAAVDAQIAALAQLIEQHQGASELKALFKQAIELTRSEKPSASKAIWEKIAVYGGAIGSIASGIAGMLEL